VKISQTGIDLIKSRESCRLKAYKCPAGIWTIGYGITGNWVHEGLEITQQQANDLFNAELTRFDAAVSKTCPESTDYQHSAMVSLAYNIGTGGFAKSSVARLHNQGKYAEAAQAFALWNRGGGRVLPGLVARRAEEAALYLKGVNVTETPNGEGEKPLSQSRTMQGQAATGVGIAATTAISAVQDNMDIFGGLKETLTELVPYVPYAGYGIAAVTLAAFLVPFYARWKDRSEGRS
jgi:lysozyme